MQPHPFMNDPVIGLCPLQAFRDNPEMEAISFALHQHWSHGILPSPGGLDDQPANYSAVVLSTEAGVVHGRERRRLIAEREAESKQRRSANKGKGKGGRRSGK